MSLPVSNTTYRMPNKSSFTLVELLAVVMVIGIVAAIILGVSGIATKKSDTSKAEAELHKIRFALDDHYSQHGYYPEAGQGWVAVKELEIGQSTDYFEDEYTEINVEDPWGSNYLYKKPSPTYYMLGSKGPDGEYGDNSSSENNFGKGDDIVLD